MSVLCTPLQVECYQIYKLNKVKVKVVYMSHVMTVYTYIALNNIV